MSQSGGLPLPTTQKHVFPSQGYVPNPNEEPNILEQSLSSETKLVIVPHNKLQMMAQNPGLLETWK